jgi:hypothetical protein
MLAYLERRRRVGAFLACALAIASPVAAQNSSRSDLDSESERARCFSHRALCLSKPVVRRPTSG